MFTNHICLIDVLLRYTHGGDDETAAAAAADVNKIK